MSEHNNVGDLFDLSLASEREAEAFYAGLASMFEGSQKAVEAFEALRQDEARHIEEISSLRASLPDAQMLEPVPERVLVLLNSFLRFSAKEALLSIKSLEDAYRLAINLEFSEVNRLHNLLFELYTPSKERMAHTKAMLDEHLKRVKSLPRSL